MKKFIKKADIVLIVSILTIACLASIQTKMLTDKYSNEAKVKITINGKIFGDYPLNKPREIAINNHFKNIIEIKKVSTGKKKYRFIVKMKSAKCPNEDCVHHSPISFIGQNIVCIPAKLIVEITNEKEKENQHIDGYTY